MLELLRMLILCRIPCHISKGIGITVVPQGLAHSGPDREATGP